VLYHPRQLGFPYLRLEVHVVGNNFPIEDQVIEPKDQCRMARCLRLALLTDRYHVGKELFEDYPTLISESQLDESEDRDCRDSLDSRSDWGME